MKKLQIKNYKLKANQKGFTLVEMLVAISLFTVIVSFSLGSVIAIFDANRKARSSKTVVDNLNFSIENMVRTIRFGDHYFCGTSNNINATNDCNEGGSDSVSVTFNNERIIYKLNGTAIQISSDGGINYSDITSSDTKINYLRFYVFGANEMPNVEQPYVIVLVEGYVSEKPTIQTEFSLETLISQRTLDI